MKRIIKPEILQESVPYKNDYFKVIERTILFKEMIDDQLNTLEKQYYFLECLNFIIAIVKDGDNILITNQYRPAINKFNTEFVAGIIDQKETPEDCARREVLEEVGLIAKNMILLGEINPQVGKSDYIAYVYLVDKFEISKPQLEATEQFSKLTSRWIPLKEFENMIALGKIKDASTLAAFSLMKAKGL